ncbi:hypothetical protein JCM18903_2974 [Psychrobacter sp. JCM 18903]|nr:hypothetical protein JCM18903_2974 [Psychrobacter sp. JCM 18903]
MVDRIIIMDNQKIVMDGPKAQVLEQLKGNDEQKTANKPSIKVSTPRVKVISNKTASISSKNKDERDNLGQDNG